MVAYNPIFSESYVRSALGDELEVIWGAAVNDYKRYDLSYKKVFEQRSTHKKMIELLTRKTLGYGNTAYEGVARNYDTTKELWTTRTYMTYHQSNYIVTWQTLKALTKNQLMKNLILSSAERALSLQMKKDMIHGIFINNYDSATQVFGDLTPIASTTQPNGDGTTFSNLASAASSVNEASIEAGIKVLRKLVDSGGKSIMPNPKYIYSGTDLEFDALRLLETEFALGSDSNTINTINRGKYLPGGHVMSPHIANDRSFALITDVPDGLITFTNQEAIFGTNPVPGRPDTEFTAFDAYAPTIGNKRVIYMYPRG